MRFNQRSYTAGGGDIMSMKESKKSQIEEQELRAAILKAIEQVTGEFLINLKIQIVNNTVIQQYPNFYVEIFTGTRKLSHDEASRFIRILRNQLNQLATVKGYKIAYIEGTVPARESTSNNITLRISFR